ncbi:MAG: DUF6472 family protein [Eubacterium sp.]|nr:DUF6472 family protein [Eubacterium sp.]
MSECDTCANFYIDEDGDEICDVELDEDEYARYLSSHPKKCPYYQDSDDYKIVRHQA